MWRKPVGLGAMRTRTDMAPIVGVAAGASRRGTRTKEESTMTTTSAQMAYLDLTLQQSGKVKGDSTTTSLNRKGLIEVWEFEHDVSAPRDPATGQATGRRIEKPIRIVTPVGTASAILFQALVGNETLVKAVFRFFKHDRAGKEKEFFKITIEDGTISSMSTQLPNVKGDAAVHAEYHDLEFTYRKITIENLEAGNSATDDWQALT
jgi:type VI secretion system secreted protein Hcp